VSSYKYSFAIENFHNEYYWSEKIADCFLAWTMPIYYGCEYINNFFPLEAMIRIDINDPDVVEIIKESIATEK
jgi:hypothetical protein